MKKDAMGGICSTHGREENLYIIGWKGRDYSEDIAVDGRII
jgi:hypothetical protein